MTCLLKFDISEYVLCYSYRQLANGEKKNLSVLSDNKLKLINTYKSINYKNCTAYFLYSTEKLHHHRKINVDY